MRAFPDTGYARFPVQYDSLVAKCTAFADFAHMPASIFAPVMWNAFQRVVPVILKRVNYKITIDWAKFSEAKEPLATLLLHAVAQMEKRE